MFASILHPTDFSDSATNALRLAAGLAAAHNASLHVFHAEAMHGEEPVESTALDDCVATARGLLDKHHPNGQAALKVSTLRSVLAFDGVMEAMADNRPDLVVMGTHGRTGFSKLLMGSTAEKVLRHASCHVMTVKAGAAVPEDGTFHKLLVPVDFSPCARRGLDGARAIRSIPSGNDAVINLVHIVEPVPPMYYAGAPSSHFELDPDLRGRIEDSLHTWAGDMPGTKVVITEGSPALELVRLAEALRVDLIVTSTKGLTGAEHLLLGSVTERVCRFSAVPVLTMR